MKTIAAIQTSPNALLDIAELEVPNPSDDQVIVNLISSGICHSQLHQMENSSLPRPLVFGHEGTGVVSHVGRSVDHVKEGDRVIVTWVPRVPVKGRPSPVPTGVTYQEQLVHGNVYTWGQDVLVNKDYVVPISPEDPSDVSCLVGCAVLTGAGAVLNTAKARPGDSIAVFGVLSLIHI